MIEILVVGLVAYRIWRIVGADTLTHDLRNRLTERIDRAPGSHRFIVKDFLECPWCAGFWITGAVTLAAFWFGLLTLPVVAVWLAASTIVGAIGSVI